MTSWNNVRTIDRFLSRKLIPEYRVAFRLQLTKDQTLQESVQRQMLVHRILRIHHQRKLKSQLDDVFQALYYGENKSKFKIEIDQIFSFNS